MRVTIKVLSKIILSEIIRKVFLVTEAIIYALLSVLPISVYATNYSTSIYVESLVFNLVLVQCDRKLIISFEMYLLVKCSYIDSSLTPYDVVIYSTMGK